MLSPDDEKEKDAVLKENATEIAEIFNDTV
jgi:hypothetical protein